VTQGVFDEHSGRVEAHWLIVEDCSRKRSEIVELEPGTRIASNMADDLEAGEHILQHLGGPRGFAGQQ
jgi:hypothetical protein